MLKYVFVLVLCGTHTCYGDTSDSDWRSRGWYRPRRNYPSQGQNQNPFGIKTGSPQNQKPESFGQTRSFGSNFKQQQIPFDNFGEKYQNGNDRSGYNGGLQSQTSFRTNNAKNYQNGNTFGTKSGTSFGNSFSSNAQSPNSFGTSFSNSRLDYAHTQNQNSFGFVQSQNQNTLRANQNQNSFGNSYTQTTHNENAFRNNYNQQAQTQNSFGSYQNSQNQRQNSFGPVFAQNQFQDQNSRNFNIGTSSSNFRGQAIFKGPDYLPPYIAPGYLPSKDPTTTTRRPFFTTTTRRPFYTTSTTKRPFFTTSTTKVAPAMAMGVPTEPEDEPTTTKIPATTITTTSPRPTTTTTTTPQPTTTTTTTTTPPPTTTTTTTTTPRPTTTTSTTTTTTPLPTTPPPTTTTTTTAPLPTTITTTTTTTSQPTTMTTTTTTPPPTTTTTTTTTTPPPTMTTPVSTTPDYNRMLVEETPKTTTTTTTESFTPYTAPQYLPPKNTTSILPVPPSPALAIPVPPEPECNPLDPKTYPYPIGIDERASIDPCSYVPVRTTTKKPFVGPAYLPPLSARVGRSPKTMRLGDVEGARPVWHVGLYTKTTTPYKQICGGSIVQMDVVITAAHCVWNDDTLLEPASNYAVGANKIYRPWTEPHDKRAQRSDVREIIVPPRYRGGKTSFQDDIALLKLVTPFSYARGLRPVCVNFDDDFDDEQLAEGNSGTVAGWGYTDELGSQPQYLLWLELPYVDIQKCIAGADDAFLKYITSDKICAGEHRTGKALCKGDSGGGLVFWHSEGELITPYLRGVASASARADNKECNVNVVGGFTQLTAHRRFLQKQLPGIDQNCRYHYFN